MGKTASDRLALSVTQVDDDIDKVLDDGITEADLPGLFSCLNVLADVCYQTVFLVQRAVQDTGPEHPIHATPCGLKVRSALIHAEALYGSAGMVVEDAERSLREMSSRAALGEPLMTAPQTPPGEELRVELREAAARLRETAAPATPGPWTVIIRYLRKHPSVPAQADFITPAYGARISVQTRQRLPDARWQALLHPGLAEPLADALEGTADGCRTHQALLAIARVLNGKHSDQADTEPTISPNQN